MTRIFDLTLDHSIDPIVAPEPQAEFSLGASFYAGDELTVIQFTINRTVRTDQVCTIDWAVTNASVLPLSSTETFGLGQTTLDIFVTAQEVLTDESGLVTLSNPLRVSGPDSAPILGSPSQATFNVNDTSQAPTGIIREAGGRDFTSIQAAWDQAVPGDTYWLENDTANQPQVWIQNATPTVSGSIGNYIEFAAHPNNGATDTDRRLNTSIRASSNISTFNYTDTNNVHHIKMRNLTLGDDSEWLPADLIKDPNDNHTQDQNIETRGDTHHLVFINVGFRGANKTAANRFLWPSTHHICCWDCHWGKHGSNRDLRPPPPDRGDVGDTCKMDADHVVVGGGSSTVYGGHTTFAWHGSWGLLEDSDFDCGGWDLIHGFADTPGSRFSSFGPGQLLNDGHPPWGHLYLRRIVSRDSGPSWESGSPIEVRSHKIEGRFVTVFDSLYYDHVDYCIQHSRGNASNMDFFQDNARLFHITFYKVGTISQGRDSGRTRNFMGHDWKIKNNIMAQMQQSPNDKLWDIVYGEMTTFYAANYTNANGLLDWVIENNVIGVKAGGTEPAIRVEPSDLVLETDDIFPTAHTKYPANIIGNIQGNATFVDPDLRLTNPGNQLEARQGLQITIASLGYEQAIPSSNMIGAGATTVNFTIGDPHIIFCAKAYDIQSSHWDEPAIIIKSSYIKVVPVGLDPASNGTIHQVDTFDYDTGIGTFTTPGSWLDGADIYMCDEDGTQPLVHCGIGPA